MDLSQVNLFKAMGSKMAYLSERQAVLAQNIANANTPGYIPQDLKKVDFNALVAQQTGGLQPAKTHAGHMAMNTTSTSNFGQTNQSVGFDVTPTGNAVNIEEQMLKLNQTAMDYQATTSLYKKMTLLVNTAVGER